MTKQLLKCGILAGIILLAASTTAPAQEWKRSEKKDDIETFYLADKVASDRFAVTIRVTNNRPGVINATVQVKYKALKPDFRRALFAPQIGAYRDQCTVLVPAGGTNSCTVGVTAKKVTGVKIARWEYAH